MSIRTLVAACAGVLAGGPAQAGLIQHLDATDASSVMVNTFNEVSVWDNQAAGTTPYDAAGDTGTVLYPSTSLSFNDLAGLDFGTFGPTLGYSGGMWRCTYPQGYDPGEVGYVVGSSTDLVSWTPVPPSSIITTATGGDVDWATAVIPFTDPGLFLKLSAYR